MMESPPSALVIRRAKRQAETRLTAGGLRYVAAKIALIPKKLAVVMILAVIAASARPVPSWAAQKSFTLTVEKKWVDIGGGMSYQAWAYDGTIPGPILHVNEGDEVSVQLLNHTPDAHGLNIRAAQISPDHFGGDSAKPLSYEFRADVPGAFLYHCNGIPILDHIGRGMYGLMIVDPKGGWPSGPAQEVPLVQSEFYGIPRANGRINPDHTEMLSERANFVLFNGKLNEHGAEHPISIKVGKLVRIFFVNAGPNLTSTFHVAGVIFSTVYQGGNPANPVHGIDSLMVGPGAGAVFEFTVREPGDYRFMDLNRAHQYNGAMGVFRAEP
jgi:nitrite reductase (NO-forming)